MKKTIFLQILFFPALFVFSQNNSPSLSSAWGHYLKLSAYNSDQLKSNINFDSLRYELAPGETKVTDLKNPIAELIGNGRKREPFYLSKIEKFEINDPPANSSLQTRNELDYLLQLQSLRSAEDERVSAYYAGVYYRSGIQTSDRDYARFQRNLFHIGRSIGTWFNAETLPLTAALVANVWSDASYYIWKYKNYFLRIRPYKLETKLKNLEETNWAAYPSGHATNSYVNAFLYSALIPEFESFFMKDAYDMAHSREIIGVHYPSDSESGRLLAYQILMRLHSDEAFKKDFAAAQEEIKKARATSKF
jgi:acid phosphatase (class A)